MSLAEDAVRRVADALENDAEFRAAMRDDPNAAMAARGLDEMHVGVRVVVDTEDTHHVVFPPAPNADLADDELDSVAGGLGYAGHASGRAAAAARFESVLARIIANRQW